MLVNNTLKSFARPGKEKTTSSGKTYTPTEAHEVGQLKQLKQAVDSAIASNNNSYSVSVNPYSKNGEQRYCLEFRFWTAKDK